MCHCLFVFGLASARAERLRVEKLQHKQEDRRLARDAAVVLEELAPKETGREAMLEKR